MGSGPGYAAGVVAAAAIAGFAGGVLATTLRGADSSTPLEARRSGPGSAGPAIQPGRPHPETASTTPPPAGGSDTVRGRQVAALRAENVRLRAEMAGLRAEMAPLLAAHRKAEAERAAQAQAAAARRAAYERLQAAAAKVIPMLQRIEERGTADPAWRPAHLARLRIERTMKQKSYAGVRMASHTQKLSWWAVLAGAEIPGLSDAALQAFVERLAREEGVARGRRQSAFQQLPRPADDAPKEVQSQWAQQLSAIDRDLRHRRDAAIAQAGREWASEYLTAAQRAAFERLPALDGRPWLSQAELDNARARRASGATQSK